MLPVCPPVVAGPPVTPAALPVAERSPVFFHSSIPSGGRSPFFGFADTSPVGSEPDLPSICVAVPDESLSVPCGAALWLAAEAGIANTLARARMRNLFTGIPFKKVTRKTVFQYEPFCS